MGARDALMASGFEVLGHSRALQVHWARRFGAYALDVIVVLMPTWTILTILRATQKPFLSIAAGAAFMAYGTAAEMLLGKTHWEYVVSHEVWPAPGRFT